MIRNIKYFFNLILIISLFSPVNGQNEEAKTFCPNMTPFINSFNGFSICNGNSVILYTNQGNFLSYQWLLNGTEIQGATASYLYVSQPGSYSVWITNGTCVNVATPVNISSGTFANIQLNMSGTKYIASGDSLKIAVAGGTSWQWFKNFIAIPGANESFYFGTS